MEKKEYDDEMSEKLKDLGRGIINIVCDYDQQEEVDESIQEQEKE